MSFADMFRPSGFSDLNFSEKITELVAEQFARQLRSGPLILEGPHGSAKSTTARIIRTERLALQGLGGEPFVVNGAALGQEMEGKFLGYLNGQLCNGETMPCWIIDEIDEIPPKYKARFQQFLDDNAHLGFAIMTTNHIGRVPSGLQSRAQICHMGHMPSGHWLPKLKAYLHSKGVSKPHATLELLLSKAGPSIRDVEQLADTLAP